MAKSSLTSTGSTAAAPSSSGVCTIALGELAWLSSIFGFPDLPAPAHQSMKAIFYYRTQLRAFLAAVQDQAKTSENTMSTSSQLWMGLLHPSALAILTTVSTWLAADDPAILWMPDFGCAVLPVRAPVAVTANDSGLNQAAASTSAAAGLPAVLLPDDLALYLVFPDGWEFDIS
eukprot:gene1982-2304_t